MVRAPIGDLDAIEAVTSGSDIRDVEVYGTNTAFYSDSAGVHVAGGATLYAGSAGRFDASDALRIFVMTPDVASFPKDESEGPTTILGAGKGGFSGVASDSATVFAIASVGTVARVDKDGTDPNGLLAVLSTLAHDIAVDDLDDQIYVAVDGSIGRLPKSGGELVTLETGSLPWRVLLDEDNVYWFDLNTADVWRTSR